MSSSGLFYAYAKQSGSDGYYCYLIVFANRDVADNWWRVVTQSVADGYTRFAQVQRISPQFYTHNPSVGNISQTITDEKVAKSFLDKIVFTLLNNRDGRVFSIAPTLKYDLTDHESGKGFFICSSVQRNVFWYYKKSVGRVVASRDLRTKFVITIHNPERPYPAGTIMISTDSILISLVSGESVRVSDCNCGGLPCGGDTNESSEDATSGAADSAPNIGGKDSSSVTQNTRIQNASYRPPGGGILFHIF